MPIDPNHHVAIIGAGPCGLACARELRRLGHHRFTVFEAAEEVGGLARSVIDPAGFTWDLGGHVVFSHYGEFDALLAEVMGDDVGHHDRSSFVSVAGAWVPYPFQNNLRHLPAPLVDECLAGLAEARGGDTAMNFGEWMEAVFGAGITRLFMAPYNRKVWATDPAAMQSRWIGERVALIDHARAAEAVATGTDDLGWGPNSRFVFPVRGGTGEIYRRAAGPLADHLRLRAPVAWVDADAGRLGLRDGSEVPFGTLVSTMPLDRLVAACRAVPATVAAAAEELVHNGVHMVGVGVEAPLADDRSWLYFPDPAVPFYRVTNFAKYAAANVPDADTGRYSAYMTETAFSATTTVERDGLEDRVVDGLVRAGLIATDTPVVSAHVETVPYAYPVPTLGRDAALAEIEPWLEAHGILSRGRFGTWRYELGNMDHAVKMGVDAARRLVEDAPEEALDAARAPVLSAPRR